PHRRHAPARWRPVRPAHPAYRRPGGRPAPRLAGSRALAGGAALRGAAGPVGVGCPRSAAGTKHETFWFHGSGGRAGQRPVCGAWLLALGPAVGAGYSGRQTVARKHRPAEKAPWDMLHEKRKKGRCGAGPLLIRIGDHLWLMTVASVLSPSLVPPPVAPPIPVYIRLQGNRWRGVWSILRRY